MYQVTGGPFVDQDLETDTEGVFACGNVLHVHDLVDYVTMEGQRAAMSAKAYLDKTLTEKKSAQKIAVVAGNGLRYVLPQHIYLKDTEEKIKIFFRSRARFREVYVRASVGDNVLTRRKLLRLIPSEMESVDIKMRDLLNTGSETNGFGDLVIEVEQ
ncbi:MAG TPA: pyridine nucleotide-disulfide oxidoreductase, partial [Clostridia bacterium]|nr:pyridine nucleotide-disulfide oxidoreductase [Clostridia bacterium]